MIPDLIIAAILLAAILYTRKSIMSQISQFAEAVNASFDRIGTAVEGVSGDVQALKDEIAKLQTDPADTAALEAVKERAETIATGLEALDALTTPPAAPTE